MTQLPPTAPADSTPDVYTGTLTELFFGPTRGGLILPVALTSVGVTAANALTMKLKATTAPVTVRAGATLLFGLIPVKVTEAVTVGTAAGGTDVTIAAAPAEIAATTATTYSDFTQIPLNEEFSMTVKSESESIKVFGRKTPISTKNLIDAELMFKTIASIQDPVVKELIAIGNELSPACHRQFLAKYSDGYMLLGTFSLEAGTPDTKPAATMRYGFKGNLAGDLYSGDLNESVFAWKKLS